MIILYLTINLNLTQCNPLGLLYGSKFPIIFKYTIKEFKKFSSIFMIISLLSINEWVGVISDNKLENNLRWTTEESSVEKYG